MYLLVPYHKLGTKAVTSIHTRTTSNFFQGHSFMALTSDDLWSHVSDRAHSIGEGVLQLLSCPKVTQFEHLSLVKQQDTVDREEVHGDTRSHTGFTLNETDLHAIMCLDHSPLLLMSTPTH